MTGPECAVVCKSINTHTSGRAEVRRRSTRNPRTAIGVMWKKGETRAVEKNVDKRVLAYEGDRVGLCGYVQFNKHTHIHIACPHQEAHHQTGRS